MRDTINKCFKMEVEHTWMPSGKFIEESINTASWLKFISNLQRLGATFKYLKTQKRERTQQKVIVAKGMYHTELYKYFFPMNSITQYPESN